MIRLSIVTTLARWALGLGVAYWIATEYAAGITAAFDRFGALFP